MARGRLGGTKSKIRGKVGSEIYQLKRDPAGTLLQQVYAQNPNPTYSNSETQAKNRCIMGQVERMWHFLPDIIRSCYTQVEQGALSFQRFSKLNYPLLRREFEEHFSEGHQFDWQAKRSMTAPAGIWNLTIGDLPPVTWNNTTCAQGWNNSYSIQWYNAPENPTYGDFLALFGMQQGDTLFSANFRQMYRDGSTFVDVFRFKPRSDYPLYLPWSYVDDEHVFETDCPYIVIASYDSRHREFYFEIDAQDAVNWLKIACFAFFVVRPTDNGTLFSSSQFRWALNQELDSYYRHSPSDVFNSWLKK